MLRGRRLIFWLIIVTAVIATASLRHRNGKPVLLQSEAPPGTYSVSHFVDGDTIAVNMNGHSETVRFIGIDTPETHKPKTPVQCYGPAAAAFTKNAIGSKYVRLEADSLTTDRDKYGRLLRYVYLPDGTNLNYKLVSLGYAFYYPYFPFTKAEEFEQAQTAAKTASKGLWGNCSPTPTSGGGYVSNPIST